MTRYLVRPRIRVTRNALSVLGPGKADLLEAVHQMGSIRAAAEALQMSYMRAWSLIRTMNAEFVSPLVEKTRGGSERGGAAVTERGLEVLDLYRRMERESEKAIQSSWPELRKHLR